ncbi:MAG TPA: NAD+ synthase [Candidatus Acidoferrales bacterium]|nr:NAD+ synthase [Candidatus Acidoferrales bacterium]
MKIALCQFDPTVGDFTGNSNRILDLAADAARGGADVAVFSELCVCGYLPQDLLERPAFLERNRTAVAELAKAAPLPILVGYAAQTNSLHGKPAWNAAALLAEGRIVFEQHKMLLPTYDVFDESRYFQPATRQRVFAFGGEKLGITICEDIWNDKAFWAKRLYDSDPVVDLVGQGAGIILNISASPYTIEKRHVRFEMLRALARTHNRAIVYVNQVGGDDTLVFDGSSLAVMPDGRFAAQASAFEEDLVIFDTTTGSGDLRAQPADEISLALQALILGTRDYVHKCGFRKALVGLSGGIDSSVVACIAVAALGKENVTGISMPGPYSSEGSIRDARQLAANLGIQFLVLPIANIFDAYRKALADAFSECPPDVTEENIQARIRGNILMALSNKFGALVLSTGNKSEIGVGYCTLYGDMAGGLAVISDVPKTMVYELAHAINRESELVPRASIEKAPSAELRPNQTDQDTLPPYDLLDRILRAYVEEVHTPQEIAEHFRLPLEFVRDIALKVDRSEYKRKQAAPGIKITSRAFGFGRPFPIAQKFLP